MTEPVAEPGAELPAPTEHDRDEARADGPENPGDGSTVATEPTSQPVGRPDGATSEPAGPAPDEPNPNVRENPDGSRWVWDGTTWHFVPVRPAASGPVAGGHARPTGPQYAGYWRRALAAILDLALLVPLYWFASTALVSALVPELRVLSSRGTEAASAWLQDGNWDRLLAPLALAWLMVLAVVPIVDALALSRRGATFGRRHAGVSVVTAAGGELDFARAWRRSLARLPTLALLGLPAIAIVFSAEKCAIHDRIAGTRVIVAATPPRAPRTRR